MVDGAPASMKRRTISAWLAQEIDALFPGAFALVMATGIISNAFYFEGEPGLSHALFAINVAAYGWLVTTTILRAFRVPRALWRDLTNPRQVFAFFTFIAATDVVGVGIILRGLSILPLALWLVALAAWLLLIYAGFGVLAFRNTGREADIVHGGWLIGIVGTQSLAILGTDLASSLGPMAPLALVLTHALWGIGLVFYGIYITLFAERIFFLNFDPDDITPLLWVVMGAAAISVNAGAVLITTDTRSAFLEDMRGFIGGVTLIAWAWATWWIPLLALLGIWKHGLHRVPMRYDPILWALVFPLGMYALATLRLGLVADVAALKALSAVMAWVAFAAWLATAIGLVVALWASCRNFVRAGGVTLTS